MLWISVPEKMMLNMRKFTKDVTNFFVKLMREVIFPRIDFVRFQQEQAHWLGDYALFMAVKDRFREFRGQNGQRISAFAGRMHWIITEKNCILKLNSGVYAVQIL